MGWAIFFRAESDQRPTFVSPLKRRNPLDLKPPPIDGREPRDGPNSFTSKIVPTVTSKERGPVPATRTVIVPGIAPIIIKTRTDEETTGNAPARSREYRAHVHNARRIRSIHRPLSERIPCSQSRMTVQPAARKRRKFRWSRLLFARNFDLQNPDSLCSHAGNRHPCQKSPSMKIATFFLRKTISGVPFTLL